MKRRKLGEVLREQGKIGAEELSQLISEQQGQMTHLGELMLERGIIRKADLVAALAEVTHVPYLDARTVEPGPDVLRLVPQGVAERCCALPVEKRDGRLSVVMAEPQNLALLGELQFTTGMEIVPRLGFRREIQESIARHYAPAESRAAGDAADSVPGMAAAEGPEDPETAQMEFVSTSARQASREALQEVQAELRQKRTPAVRLVSEFIQAAMARQASDIHIEPQARETVVRMRVDGVLRELRRIPRSLHNSLISRIKILSDMDIAERRAPQDGRFMVSLRDHKLDMRVSTLPTQYGEKVVMRLLESEAPVLSFGQLGFPDAIAGQLRRLLALPQGMLLVTGPTGSGKSTTLYSALHIVRQPSVNIITVEDPVEYVLPGINQVHVNARAGLTFASCLRSILRQDPNVIMVGEIRDQDTAEIAMKAAQTGHLVLSTLHTNDSLSALIRLLDLGIPGYLIASSVTGILAQRLVRRLCRCRAQERPSREFLARVAELGIPQAFETEYRAAGCPVCEQTGFKGRVGLYEMFVLDEVVRAAIRDGRAINEIRDMARGGGMKLLQEDAVEKVRAGITTLDEVLRVVPFEAAPATACSACGHSLLPAFRFCPYCGTRREANAGAAGSGELASVSVLRR